jgi:hypothetical protein
MPGRDASGIPIPAPCGDPLKPACKLSELEQQQRFAAWKGAAREGSKRPLLQDFDYVTSTVTVQKLAAKFPLDWIHAWAR